MSVAKSMIRPVREVTFRSRPHISSQRLISSTAGRQNKDQQPKVTQVPEGTTSGANESQIPHVSEEQAQTDKIMGQTPPDLSQGTPVQELLQRDEEAKANAPQVIKDQIKTQKRQYSTSARRLNELSTIGVNNMLEGMTYPDAGLGHKFPVPENKTLGRHDHLRRRYDACLYQFTTSIMKHGEMSKAQKHVSLILEHLRTSPPPQLNPQHPNRILLLADTPQLPPTQVFDDATGLALPELHELTQIPRSVLPMYPIEYLTTIIDSVAPLLKIKQMKGMAGGGMSTPCPFPLGIRQRRRQAIQWIMAAAEKRQEIKLSDRLGKELLKVADGTSSVWDKRDLLHRMGVSARSNIRTRRR